MRFHQVVCVTILISLFSCTKDKPPSGIDAAMYQEAIENDGFTWYKLTDVLLDKSVGSGHPQPYLRTRFNGIAASQLDGNGKVLDNIPFPEGSLIVKELYDNPQALFRYAMLLKASNNEFADNNGWVWGYINEDGNVAIPAEEKGAQCINCHSQQGNIDGTLMNKFFP